MGRHSAVADDEATAAAPVIGAESLTKSFRQGDSEVHAVQEAYLALQPGELVALAGQSGSGKSTLLSLLIGWERPDQGTIVFGATLEGGPTDPADRLWADVAVMPQTLGLLEDLTVEENVLLPARVARRLPEFTERAAALMTRLGIDHLARRRPDQTSLGEQQRTCLARALVLRPKLVFADEPTAHQDHRFAEIMLDVLREEAAGGASFLIATHNPDVWTAADRVLRMSDGVLAEQQPA